MHPLLASDVWYSVRTIVSIVCLVSFRGILYPMGRVTKHEPVGSGERRGRRRRDEEAGYKLRSPIAKNLCYVAYSASSRTIRFGVPTLRAASVGSLLHAANRPISASLSGIYRCVK